MALKTENKENAILKEENKKNEEITNFDPDLKSENPKKPDEISDSIQEAKEAEKIFGVDGLQPVHKFDNEKFNGLKQRCLSAIEKMPFEENSRKNVSERVNQCTNGNELFWNFLFDLHQDEIRKDMKNRFPDLLKEVDEITNENKNYYE